MKPTNQIPKFGLYGESSFSPDPGYVHIKDLPRNESEYDWVIKPHRHEQMFQIIWVDGGKAQIQLDINHWQLNGAFVVTIPAGVVHSLSFEPGITGMVMTIADSLLSPSLNQRASRYFADLSRSARITEFNREESLYHDLRSYFHSIKREFTRADDGHEQMMEWLVRALLMTIQRQADHRHLLSTPKSGSVQVLDRFKTLVEENYPNQWSVQQYATALGISVSTLNRLCHEHFGTTAKAVLQQRLLVEAKRHLIYTAESLEQTAYNLGFKDPAYFSRMFKQLEGVTPSDYRRLNNAGLAFT